MALELRTTTAFERDVRRVKKQGKDLEPDWILLYKVTEEALVLVRTGSHAALFGL
jgi:mRNA-degrading endonuclease YafQ of YafQ-DinJ toxin-antitoxin module